MKCKPRVWRGEPFGLIDPEFADFDHLLGRRSSELVFGDDVLAKPLACGLATIAARDRVDIDVERSRPFLPLSICPWLLVNPGRDPITIVFHGMTNSHCRDQRNFIKYTELMEDPKGSRNDETPRAAGDAPLGRFVIERQLQRGCAPAEGPQHATPARRICQDCCRDLSHPEARGPGRRNGTRTQEHLPETVLEDLNAAARRDLI